MRRADHGGRNRWLRGGRATRHRCWRLCCGANCALAINDLSKADYESQLSESRHQSEDDDSGSDNSDATGDDGKDEEADTAPKNPNRKDTGSDPKKDVVGKMTPRERAQAKQDNENGKLTYAEYDKIASAGPASRATTRLLNGQSTVSGDRPAATLTP